ncbi:MAG: PH domain-containing protein [Alphaproteobacteria bacterium]|nr:PH domain-containing protein [Alphaproteobacteria bacterium]
MAITRYTRRNLIPGEKILYAAELHMICFLFPVILLLIGGVFMSWSLIVEHVEETQQLAETSSQHYEDIKVKVSSHFSFITAFIPQKVLNMLESANAVRQMSFGLLFLLIGFVTFLSTLIKKISTEHVITNKKIIFKKGFVKVDESEISLHNVEGVKVFQSVFDRILHRGSVQINGVGMEQLDIKNIKDPNRFRHNAYTAVEKFVQRGGGYSPK